MKERYVRGHMRNEASRHREKKGRARTPYLESVHVDAPENLGGAHALGNACKSSIDQTAGGGTEREERFAGGK